MAVSPTDDAEVRRVTLTNRSERLREIELTSYVELGLGPLAEDVANPLFGKLFVETEWIAENAALLARRRPRNAGDPAVVGYHVLTHHGPVRPQVEWETDRRRFLGRGRGPENPRALEGGGLSATTGAVLDPILCLRTRLRIAPGGVARVSFTTGLARRRGGRPGRDPEIPRPRGGRPGLRPGLHPRAGLAAPPRRSAPSRPSSPSGWPRGSSSPTARCGRRASCWRRNTLGQEGLWRFGISGDLPIVLVVVKEQPDLGLVRQVLVSHEHWRLKGLKADVVILNDHAASYRDEIYEQLAQLVEGGPWRAWKGALGDIFLLRGEIRPAGRTGAAGTRSPGRSWPGTTAASSSSSTAPRPVPAVLPLRKALIEEVPQEGRPATGGAGPLPPLPSGQRAGRFFARRQGIRGGARRRPRDPAALGQRDRQPAASAPS